MTECRTQQARFFVPEWWVIAYQRALAGSSVEGAGFGFDLTPGLLLPSLDATELNFLAHMLGDFQEQILDSGSDPNGSLKLKPDHLARHIGATASGVTSIFSRLLQVVPGLRLAVPEQDAGSDLVQQTTIMPQHLFSSEKWHEDTPGQGTNRPGGPMGRLVGELKLAPMAAEAILGYDGSHSALVNRLVQSRHSIEFRNSATPLVLWRSVWLDLNAQEQALLLRMETAIQWDFRWLHLDGIFSENIFELCKGIKFPTTRGSTSGESQSELSRCLRLLARLGRKLIGHGWLATPAEDSYLAVGGAKEGREVLQGPDLVWRISPQRLNLEDLQKYRSRVADWLRYQRWKAASPVWTDFLQKIAGGKIPARATETSVELLQGTGKSSAPATVLLGPATIIDLPALYSEWLCRQLPGCKIPLPEAIAHSRAAEICAPTSSAPPEEGAGNLGLWLADNPEIVAILRNSPMATLASDVTWSHPDMRAMVGQWRGASAHFNSLAQAAGSGKELVDGAVLGTAAGESSKSGGNGHPLAKDGGVASVAVQAQVQASRMRRVAIEELQRIKEGQPDQYRDLKATFLRSLDEASRKVFAEVQARMEPRVFDEHLRQRLVKFMIDHPASWRSTSSPRGPSSQGQSGQRH